VADAEPDHLAVYVTLVQTAAGLPVVLFAVLAGTIGDPVDRRRFLLRAALQQTRFSRRRTGAVSWRAWRDASDPDRILEQFVVASWSGHLRQHERVTTRDQARLDRVRELADPARPPEVTHWLTPSRLPPPSG